MEVQPGSLRWDRESTNEELETANNELRERSLALDELNSFLESILAGASDSEEVAVKAVNRRGRAVDVLISMAPLRQGKEVVGAILVMSD